MYNYVYALPLRVHCMHVHTGACPGIRQGGGPAQKIAEKIIFSTKKVATYRRNSLKFALMTFF